MKYKELENAFHKSQLVCNPIDFLQRQNNLIYALGSYILERDKPKEDETQEMFCAVYNSYYNVNGNWTEEKCSDEMCEFCMMRGECHDDDCDCLKECDEK